MPGPSVPDVVLHRISELIGNVPMSIRIGEHVGNFWGEGWDVAPLTSSYRYQFRFSNGHMLGVVLHRGEDRADIYFLTASREAQLSREFAVLEAVIADTARGREPPTFESIDFSSMLMERSGAGSETPAEVLHSFALSSREVVAQLDAQALRYARIILGRIPAALQDWAGEWLIGEEVLASRLKEYGLSGRGGDSLIFSTRVDPVQQGFESKADFRAAMKTLKKAWADVLDVRVTECDDFRLEVSVRPLSSRS